MNPTKAKVAVCLVIRGIIDFSMKTKMEALSVVILTGITLNKLRENTKNTWKNK